MAKVSTVLVLSAVCGFFGAGERCCVAAEFSLSGCAIVPRDPLKDAGVSDLNRKVFAAIEAMPHGGTYSTHKKTFENLIVAASTLSDADLQATVSSSMCSSATYLVFLRALKDSGAQESTIAALQPTGVQPDGVGPWGWWNANGPGTGELARALGVGPNNPDLALAQPGDFMKIWWRPDDGGDRGIGPSEHGHSVVFLGCTKNLKKEDFLCYWSSNVPRKVAVFDLPDIDDSASGGYSTRCVRPIGIERALFTRLKRADGDPQKLSQFHPDTPNQTLKDFADTQKPNLVGAQADKYLKQLSAPLKQFSAASK